MSGIPEVLAELAVEHVQRVLSAQRDCRLIFPGLTDVLALELHEKLKTSVAGAGLAEDLPVYLALDSGSALKPDPNKQWLLYEAVTSVRYSSFIAVCMPKVLPKLHDSISGSGSPIRGLVFSDEWPWRDTGSEPFRFSGPVLDALLSRWTTEDHAQQWLRELTLQGLLPGTAPLRDAVRVPLLLEKLVGSFSPDLYPDLDDVIDKFLFHCGIPARGPEKREPAAEHTRLVVSTAKALDDLRRRNPDFREFLKDDAAPSWFAGLPDLEEFRAALELLMDGTMGVGDQGSILGFRGGVGAGSTSGTEANWLRLSSDRLQKLLGVGGKAEIGCVAALPEQMGLVSEDGKKVAAFEGESVELEATVNIPEEQFARGDYSVRCKRRQHEILEVPCDSNQAVIRIAVLPNELPSSRSSISLVVQLVRAHQVVDEARVRVDVCGNARPALVLLEPSFDVHDLLEGDPDDAESDSIKIECQVPVRFHILQWEPSAPCVFLLDEEPQQVDTSEASPDGSDAAWARYLVPDPVDVESYRAGRVEMHVESSGLQRDITLAGEDIESGEFTLEDELRVAAALGKASRLQRALRLFRGEGDLVLPMLGDIDSAARWRMQLAGQFEFPADGWKPILTDFLGEMGSADLPIHANTFWTTTGESPAFLNALEPSQDARDAIGLYAERRTHVLEEISEYVSGYESRPDRPHYIVAPLFIAERREAMEMAIAEYLEAYASILDLVRLHSDALRPGELFLLLNLDSVVLERGNATGSHLDYRIVLLGPWHPLVVAKRFMVQSWLYAAARSADPLAPEDRRLVSLARNHRHLVSLFERVDGFRLLSSYDPNARALEVSFAFPTSDPGWHVAISEGAFTALRGTPFRNLLGLGEQLRRSIGLRSSLYLSGAEMWSESFVNGFRRSHPSRYQIGLRIDRGLDPGPVVESCTKLLSSKLGTMLPGGLHVFLQDRIENREPLAWQDPMVFLYEDLPDEDCYRWFHPDILLQAQREDWKSTWLSGRTHEVTPVPRGRGLGSAFFVPLADLSEDTQGLPVTRLIESTERTHTSEGTVRLDPDEDRSVGGQFGAALRKTDALAARVRPQRPALIQELGLPRALQCDWTVVPGIQVDAGALAKYIVSGRDQSGEDRALWDYRVDVGQSVSSYYVVSKVPASARANLASNVVAPGVESATAMIRELGEVGFAVGETMRSGKSAVGVLGVVGALRLIRAAWKPGVQGDRRWVTVVLPVDSFTAFLVPPRGQGQSSMRTDLLVIHLSWNTIGEANLVVSPCTVECKYVSSEFPAGAVNQGLAQAVATYKVIHDLVELAQSDIGMHARLALAQVVRFGLRLLAARGEVGLADESRVLEALLHGAFELQSPLTSTLLVTTSAGGTGPANVDFRTDGWWVRLTRESWPTEVPKSPNNLVDQLAVVFRNEPFEGTHEPGDMHGTASSQELAADTATGADAGEVSPSPKASPTQAQPVAGPRRLQHDKEARHLEEKDIVHPVFSGFVGNAAAVKTLSIRLRYAAKTESRAIRALGLFGPKSTGKTELARRIAQALGVPPLFLSETGLGDIDNLAERMQALARESGTPMTPVGRQGGLPILRSPPMLVFIDEVHELKPKVQDSLLPVLEADDRTLRGSRVIINARDVTFVVATTDDGRLREPFRSRVRAIRLNVYTAEEVRQMLRHQVNAVSEGESKGSTPIDPVVAQLEDEALLAIATAARAVPRVALDLLREVGEALRIGHLDPSVESVWSYLQGMIPCDRQGLTRQDHQYLQILSTHRGPVGLDNIATQLGIDRSNVDRAIEPFLVQMDWVQRRSGGRVLTPKGQRLLAELRTQAP